ncbi:MAG TPA: OsmC family protein [Candidatus Kapabacteria bacterium]|jgi:putative redox protein|nr:OsmC family protein [Candidatus Kapabacteria bacterium]
MKAQLRLDPSLSALRPALRFIGTNEKAHETYFDTTFKGGGLDSAASPMEITLEAAAACSAMDVIPILQKRRKTVENLTVELLAERAETHPKVFTSIEMHFRLVSPDATLKELAAAIELSHSKYCSISVMLARSGCNISWTATLQNPNTGSTETLSSREFQALLDSNEVNIEDRG